MATNPNSDDISLKAEVEILVSTMRNPLKANICASRLGHAAGRIHKTLQSCASIAAKAKIAKSYPEFLRVGIKFLTFKQSLQDQLKMMNHLSSCHCGSGKRCLHDDSIKLEAVESPKIIALDHLFHVVSIVANSLMLALNDLTQHKFRTGNAMNGEKRWPQGPEDLLPHGPKDSVLGLELWVSFPPFGYIIFKLAGCLAVSHVPFAREIFQQPNFTFALVRPFGHIVAAIKFHELGKSSPSMRTHYFTHPVMIIFDFFDNLSQCNLPRYHSMIAGKSFLSPVLARLSTILSPLPEEWAPTRVKVLYLSAYANAKFDPVTGLGEIKFDRELILNEFESHDGLEGTFTMMIEARRLGCSNILCSSASEVVHSRLCAKCNLIRFCGKKASFLYWLFFFLSIHATLKQIIYSFSVKRKLGTVLRSRTSRFAQRFTT